MRDSSFSNREVLIEASLNEFINYSYEKASLNRIIKNAGISKGTFYYHFKNKEDLYKHLLETGAKEKWDFINKYAQENQADLTSMDLFDKFMYHAKSGTIYANKHPKYNKLGSMFAKEKGTSIYDTIIKEVGGDSTNTLKTMVHMAYESGELDTTYSEDFIFKILHSLFSNFDEIFKDERELGKILTNLNEYVRFMKNGLKSQ